MVQVTAPVWSCQSCFHVFHLNCIKKWARSPASHADGQSGWRCPACQNVSAHVPSTYTCFCGKVKNPEWSRNEIPHSCGEVCRKKQPGQDCPHSCNLLCHPGPCPPCPAFTTKTCECGRTRHTVRCGQPVSVHCSNVCENILNCGQHRCAELCHAGQCQPCRIILNQGKWLALYVILQQTCFTKACTPGRAQGTGIKTKSTMRHLFTLARVSKMKD